MKDELILHQPSHATRLDRHPEVFAHAKTLLGDAPARLLSFGCASGEECYTLRRYLPHATVIGAEISLPLVIKNREVNTDPHITFIHSAYPNLEENGPYDMIFAINVLIRDVENPLEYPLYIFDYFEKQLMQFDAVLKSGGHLVLVHTQHDFAQSSLYKSGAYTPSFNGRFFQKEGLNNSFAPPPAAAIRKT